MPEPMHIGIAGAGLLGRLLAWRLARAGHRIDVFDVARSAEPVVRSLATPDDPPTAAGFTAAGMLSPLAELDNAEAKVAALGWRSVAAWRRIVAALPEPRPLLAVDGSLLLAHRGDEGAAQRVLDRLRAAVASAAWKEASPAHLMQALDASALRALAPAISGTVQAWLLPGEGFIDTVATMRALHRDAQRVDWHWNHPVLAVNADKGNAELHLVDGRVLAFDAVIDVRGVGAKGMTASPIREGGGGERVVRVRGVRGEIITLHCPDHGLTRAVRLLHPRHRVYIVPRSPQQLIVGASEIESEDRSPVSLRSAVELMAAAHSVMPALAEARIVALDVNLRPALPDNNPRIEHGTRKLAINGLFRHGWLLAPALVDQALRENGWVPDGLALDSMASGV